MRHFACTLLTTICLTVPSATYGSDDEPPRRIDVSYDQATETAHVAVPVREGRMQWGDLLRGVVRARGFDDDALEGTWTEKSVPVTGIRGHVFLAGLNRLFGPGVHMEVSADEETGDGVAQLTLDRRALLSSQRRFKQRLKQGLQLVRPRRSHYGLAFDDDWDDAPEDKHLVVLVHGLQSATERLEWILDDVRELGFPCATFDYPNDQPIDDSAQLLAEQLAATGEEHPERKITLLTHSMGGLVARAVIEDELLDPGNVNQLIMVAPPNHGSLLAHFAFGFDFWEYLGGVQDRTLVEKFFEAIEDGLGEAPDDLRTTSLFLERLNSRPRNPEVRYTILLGTDAPLSDSSLAGLRRSLEKAGARNRYARFLGSKLDSYLADLEEVVGGKGDGAVALKRGRLEGVADTEELQFDHLDFSGPQDTPGAKRIREGVLERL